MNPPPSPPAWPRNPNQPNNHQQQQHQHQQPQHHQQQQQQQPQQQHQQQHTTPLPTGKDGEDEPTLYGTIVGTSNSPPRTLIRVNLHTHFINHRSSGGIHNKIGTPVSFTPENDKHESFYYNNYPVIKHGSLKIVKDIIPSQTRPLDQGFHSGYALRFIAGGSLLVKILDYQARPQKAPVFFNKANCADDSYLNLSPECLLLFRSFRRKNGTLAYYDIRIDIHAQQRKVQGLLATSDQTRLLEETRCAFDINDYRLPPLNLEEIQQLGGPINFSLDGLFAYLVGKYQKALTAALEAHNEARAAYINRAIAILEGGAEEKVDIMISVLSGQLHEKAWERAINEYYEDTLEMNRSQCINNILLRPPMDNTSQDITTGNQSVWIDYYTLLSQQRVYQHYQGCEVSQHYVRPMAWDPGSGIFATHPTSTARRPILRRYGSERTDTLTSNGNTLTPVTHLMNAPSNSPSTPTHDHNHNVIISFRTSRYHEINKVLGEASRALGSKLHVRRMGRGVVGAELYYCTTTSPDDANTLTININNRKSSVMSAIRADKFYGEGPDIFTILTGQATAMNTLVIRDLFPNIQVAQVSPMTMRCYLPGGRAPPQEILTIYNDSYNKKNKDNPINDKNNKNNNNNPKHFKHKKTDHLPPFTSIINHERVIIIAAIPKPINLVTQGSVWDNPNSPNTQATPHVYVVGANLGNPTAVELTLTELGFNAAEVNKAWVVTDTEGTEFIRVNTNNLNELLPNRTIVGGQHAHITRHVPNLIKGQKPLRALNTSTTIEEYFAAWKCPVGDPMGNNEQVSSQVALQRAVARQVHEEWVKNNKPNNPTNANNPNIPSNQPNTNNTNNHNPVNPINPNNDNNYNNQNNNQNSHSSNNKNMGGSASGRNSSSSMHSTTTTTSSPATPTVNNTPNKPNKRGRTPSASTDEDGFTAVTNKKKGKGNRVSLVPKKVPIPLSTFGIGNFFSALGGTKTKESSNRISSNRNNNNPMSASPQRDHDTGINGNKLTIKAKNTIENLKKDKKKKKTTNKNTNTDNTTILGNKVDSVELTKILAEHMEEITKEHEKDDSKAHGAAAEKGVAFIGSSNPNRTTPSNTNKPNQTNKPTNRTNHNDNYNTNKHNNTNNPNNPNNPTNPNTHNNIINPTNTKTLINPNIIKRPKQPTNPNSTKNSNNQNKPTTYPPPTATDSNSLANKLTVMTSKVSNTINNITVLFNSSPTPKPQPRPRSASHEKLTKQPETKKKMREDRHP